VLWIGTSGWVYRDWAGHFYPPELPASAWLAFYAREFPTVEINRSYYRLPTEAQFRAWAAQVPPGFCFAVKASRFLTHMKKLRDPEEPLARLTGAAGGLGGKLGPYLYQLPPHWRADPARLAHFVALLGGQRAAFEFRDPSWETAAVYDILAAAGCALAIGVRGGEPAAEAAPLVGPFGYIRFHHGGTGVGFTDEELRPWAERLAGESAAGREVYVYFNNDPGGHAIADARRLREMFTAIRAKLAGSVVRD
jgi:uncharacterized protein YecE (DUF72 family)